MDKIGVKFGVNWCEIRSKLGCSLRPRWGDWSGGDKKCLRVGVNPLGGGSYICVRLILGRII